MNGPEHYREAERLLELAANIGPVLNLPAKMSQAEADRIRQQFGAIVDQPVTVLGGEIRVDMSGVLAAAQVHATLALAAATAAHQATQYDGDENGSRSRGWSSVA